LAVKSITVAMVRKVMVFGQRPTDDKPFPVGRRRPTVRSQRQGDTDITFGGAEIVPGRLVGKIEHGADDQVEGGQTRRGGELADHHDVGGEVERRDDDAKGDGLGNRLLDPKPGRGCRLDVLPLAPRSRARLPSPAAGRAEQRLQAPPQRGQVLGRQHGGTADHQAWDQRRLEQGGTGEHC
jgi:hypothetical protein